MNMGMKIPLYNPGFIFFGNIHRNELADNMVVIVLIFGETSILFLIMAIPKDNPITNM